MRALTYSERLHVSAGEKQELEPFDPYLMAGVVITAFSVGTMTAYGGYYLTLHGTSWGWRVSALLASFYGGFTLGSLAGAGTLFGLSQI